MTTVPRPVSVVTVTHDTLFFVRLLVEKVREFTRGRHYEIIVVDRGSRDGTIEWLQLQPDVRLLAVKKNRRGHGHGEAAEFGAAHARYDHVALLDSDAHPVSPRWLELTVDQLDARARLAGGVFHRLQTTNRYGWYIHPHFMAFHRADLVGHVTLRKIRGTGFDTAEAATVNILDAGLDIVKFPIERSTRFDVQHPHFPTETAGVFHAWYGTRMLKEKGTVLKETAGLVDEGNYLAPLVAKLRREYSLDY